MMPNVAIPISLDKTLFLISLLCCVSITSADIAQFGACFQESTNAYRCAVNSAYCFSKYGEVWFEPYKLKRLEGRKLCGCGDTHIGSCRPSHGYRGNCALEAPVCPADDEFDSTQWFFNDGATCKCHGMTGHQYSTNVIETEKTIYGACQEGDNIRCAVHSTSCEVGEQWLNPQKLESMDESQCTCDKVRTGSCVSPFGVQCVVDSESCDADLFLTPFVTMAKGDDCFLCDAVVFETYESDISNDSVIATDNFSKSDDEKNSETVEEIPKQTASRQANNTVSKTTFGVVLGFMVSFMVGTVALTAYLVYLNRKSVTSGARNVENSVV